jgi:hypothetical protein
VLCSGPTVENPLIMKNIKRIKQTSSNSRRRIEFSPMDAILQQFGQEKGLARVENQGTF